MAWEKATYWMAVAVLTLMAGNSLMNRHGEFVGRLANYSLLAAEEVSGRRVESMNLAEIMVGRGASDLALAQAKLACAQTRLGSEEFAMARGQAGLAKLEAMRAQFEAMEALRSSMICPRRRLTMVIPRSAPMPHEGTI